jgi:hypothetical protein
MAEMQKHPRVEELEKSQETLTAEIVKMLGDTEANTTDVIAKVRECKNINVKMKRVMDALAVLREEG